jgi:hypothetical protein
VGNAVLFRRGVRRGRKGRDRILWRVREVSESVRRQQRKKNAPWSSGRIIRGTDLSVELGNKLENPSNVVWIVRFKGDVRMTVFSGSREAKKVG